MRAAVVTGTNQVGIRDCAEPAATCGALIRVMYGGICGTDLKIVRGEVPLNPPVILGHEIVGSVETAPTGSSIPVGARVVVDPSLFCDSCAVCRRGLRHLCPHGGLIGRDADGGFAELLVVPGNRLHVVPDEISATDAAMLQVLSTCVHGQGQLSPQLGQRAAVIGLGVTGILHIGLLAARGISTIVGISRSKAKRELALEFGATAVGTPEEGARLMTEATAGEGADLVIECAGTAAALSQATTIAGHRATILMFGTIAPTANDVPTYHWYQKELTLLNTRAASAADFGVAISLIRSGLLRPGRLVTSSYPLDELASALTATALPGELKVTLTMPGADPLS